MILDSFLGIKVLLRFITSSIVLEFDEFMSSKNTAFNRLTGFQMQYHQYNKDSYLQHFELKKGKFLSLVYQGIIFSEF